MEANAVPRKCQTTLLCTRRRRDGQPLVRVRGGQVRQTSRQGKRYMASLLSLLEKDKGSSVHKENVRGSLYLCGVWATLTGAAVGMGGKEETARAKQGTVI